jgi:hypothetical protein
VATRRRPGKVKVTGHGHVSAGRLKQAGKELRKATGLLGPDGTATGKQAAGDLGLRLREAGEFVAAIARSNAGGWSQQIPPSIKVMGGTSGIYIRCAAPPAYPNEVAGVRHPVFGHDPWVTNVNRPFLAPAGDEGADGAAEIVARVISDWAREYGFE